MASLALLPYVVEVWIVAWFARRLVGLGAC